MATFATFHALTLPYLPSASLHNEIPFTAYLFFAPTLDQEPKESLPLSPLEG